MSIVRTFGTDSCVTGRALTPSVGLLLGRNLAVLQAYEAETFTLQTGGLARLMIAAPLRTKWLQLGRILIVRFARSSRQSGQSAHGPIAAVLLRAQFLSFETHVSCQISRQTKKYLGKRGSTILGISRFL